MARPVSKEVPYIDPVAAFALFAEDEVAAFLDSADEGSGRGRYSYIAFDPVSSFTASADPVAGADPFEIMRQLLQSSRHETDPTLPPFQGGLCGVLGYELGGMIERLPEPVGDAIFPDLAVALYDTVIAFDTFTAKAWVVASEIDPERPSAIRRLETAAERLAAVPRLEALPEAPRQTWRWHLDRTGYEDAVRKAIEYIYAGDIFQANVTTFASTDVPAGLSPFELYRRLRWLSPSPFAAYVSCGRDHKLLCGSPERFLSLSAGGDVSTRPIKGTRPRSDTPEQDAAFALELTESAKDRAENLMIVDLLRNDISRVALIGSVDVPKLFELETFARVHHLVSEVRGKLRPGYDAIDLFRATFPGGSITGAPKIRAMEIIHELEGARRGPYCGTVFWAGLDGAMDSNIVIRSLVLSEGRAYAHAGGGIVADSDPAAEYDEMRTKAQPLLASLSGEDLR